MIVVAPRVTALLSVVVDVRAITFWPLIFACRPLAGVDENHERIHLAQQRELLVLGFYLLYAWDYMMGRLIGLPPEQAYREIRFEREAYGQQDNLDYLESRPLWAWARTEG